MQRQQEHLALNSQQEDTLGDKSRKVSSPQQGLQEGTELKGAPAAALLSTWLHGAALIGAHKADNGG